MQEKYNPFPLEFPLPSAVRWIPASLTLFRGLHQGAGSIAVIMAPPEAWVGAWPAPPELAAIHPVNIDEAGAFTGGWNRSIRGSDKPVII